MKKYIENNISNMLSDLKQLVSFNSVYAEDEKPFGSQNRKVLDKALEIFKEKGLETKNLDYYCGYGQTGEGDETIGILAHLDVVPAGEGWNSDPFETVEKDGYVYGRGVTDDKGAVIAGLYAIKYLLDTGYKFKKKVRLIVGCNEESGSECIKYYVSKEGHIDYGFTPDADFPGIYGEKGMVGGIFAFDSDKILDIKGGDASNVVCKKVKATLKENSFDVKVLSDFFKENNIEYTLEDNELTVFGKAAHASTPDLGVNAINYLMVGLYKAGINDKGVDNFVKHIGLDLHGESLGLEEVKDDVTNSSVNIGIAFKEGNKICLSVDCRFPIKTNKDIVVPYFEKMENFKLYRAVNPLYFDVNSPFIKALNKAYQDVTGDYDSKMEAIGGGTYAKSINNCIAFGPEFAGETPKIHDANESLSIESLKKATEIYIEAIKNLNEL